ncbi:MAG: hypothetical protein CMJ83_11065 [Planctomycetes bacterium]|nr:hypothetical protein [Planctomycetota bacterium]
MVIAPPPVETRKASAGVRPSESLRPERDSARRLRVTMVSPHDPFPAHTGAAVRTVALARGLRRAGFDVRFEVVGEVAGMRIEDGFRVHASPTPPAWRNPIGVLEEWNPPELLSRLGAEPPDIAVVSDSRAGPSALLLGALGVRVVVDLPAVVEDLTRVRRAGTERLVEIKTIERLIAREPEGVVASSELDRDVFVRRHAAHRGRVVVFPNPASSPPVEVPQALGDAVVWLGPATSHVNRAALRRLQDSIVPLLKVLKPGTPVILAGKGVTPFGRGLGVEVIEEVEDLDAFFARARCLVVPVTCGSGSRVKVVDALARGVPVVGTPHGLAGHQDLDGYGMLWADSDRQVVDRILDLLDEYDLALELGAAGASAYRERRQNGNLMAPVIDLMERARRAWIDPRQKLEILRASVPGKWPQRVEDVKSFLERRPRRLGRWMG